MSKKAFLQMSLVTMLIAVVLCTATLLGCDVQTQSDKVAGSEVKGARADVPTGPDGLTTEQRSIRDRLAIESWPGAIKHLDVISTMSGRVLVYSSVKGKVTSSGKRLTPLTVEVGDAREAKRYNGFAMEINGVDVETPEVRQDDGTYGSSIEYLFWWDQTGKYHQMYPSAGQIIHISDKPMANVPAIVLNIDG